jgi:hypothetical protein
LDPGKIIGKATTEIVMVKPRVRRTPPSKRDKVTVTIPHDVLEAAMRNVATQKIPSLSAYLSEALAERVAIDAGENEYRAWLDQLNRELGPPSEEAYEWARNILQP